MTLKVLGLALLIQLAAAATMSSSTTEASTITTTTTQSSSSTSASRYSNPLLEHKHERNCKAICEHCGCLGFYCGEECICECNDDSSNTECIHTMQVNARSLNTPFEILIQGPSSNRFVRNAQQFEQQPGNADRRNRRSTITIYRPSTDRKRAPFSLNALDLSTPKKSELARHKRSVEHLEWFNDFANSFVRPSPLGSNAYKQRASKRQAATTERLPSPQREPWFLEQKASRLTRPAPLFKRHQEESEEEPRSRKSKHSSTRKRTKSISIEDETETEAPKAKPEIRPFRDALQVVERIPRVLQDTVTHLAADNDNNNGDVFSLNIMNDVLPSGNSAERTERPKPRRSSSKRRSRTRDSVVGRRSAYTVTPAPIELPAPAPALPAFPLAPRGLLLPWLRQRRLMRMRGE
ncbi:uncharacterized protein LOC108600500 [Drosophila busckii]|uniref:uncharacterized protein LOC108600500 n=1 Tax=Drosophila busckii TaxID=30019 RepID=UPI00083F045E|nr:uncharacterized protein LOC108600500 [Drosophila busckii]